MIGLSDVPLYCIRCGRRPLPGELACPALVNGERCNGTEYTRRVSGNIQPSVVDGELEGLLGQVATLPGGSVALLYGPPGCGKSTLALSAFELAHFATCEMEPNLIGAYARRVGCPLGSMSWVIVDELDTLDLGVAPHSVRGWPDLIFDSATATGRPLIALLAVRDYARRHGVRAIVIAHVTKAGELRGTRQLEHEADTLIELTHERLTAHKCRHAPGGSMAVRRDQRGRVVPMVGTRYYSIERTRSGYRLAPYPERGARAADMWRHGKRAGLQLPAPPCAAAAARSDVYTDGWIEPDDVDERIAFALAHGIPYFSPIRGLIGVTDHGQPDSP